ncbi:MAG: hypothetical protein PHE73_02835 [Sulfurovaceae bacterium]|nr:hypothetical protein [Sulfurovaceae bacterium]
MDKYTPLIILAIFAIAFYLMIKGMVDITEKTTKPAHQEQPSSVLKTNQ